MNSKLIELSSIYKIRKENEKNLFIYDEPANIIYDSTQKDGFNISIKKMKIGEEYIISLFIFKNKKIILNSPIYSSKENLIFEYDALKADLKILNLNDLLDKYYENIKRFLSI